MPAPQRHETIAGAPALVVCDGPPEAAARRGCVLLHHGLGGHKGLHAPELERLAGHGLLAVGIGAVGHGARRWPDFEARFRTEDGSAGRSFLDVVRATAAEVPAVVGALLSRGWALPGRAGVAGVSMGGFVAYGAALAERRLGAAVSILGSPRWDPDAAESPHRFPERFFPAALLSVTASRDAVVPPGPARDLHAALAPRYAAAPDRLRHLELAGAGHEMDGADWEAAWREATAWLVRHLGDRG